ncbi:hypothetical protein ACX80V_21170 [Arthrobacter sp. MDT3-24]
MLQLLLYRRVVKFIGAGFEQRGSDRIRAGPLRMSKMGTAKHTTPPTLLSSSSMKYPLRQPQD